MAQDTEQKIATFTCLGYQVPLAHGYAITLCLLILGLFSFNAAHGEGWINTLILFMLGATVGLVLWPAVVSKPKQTNTYTETNTTIVPPAEAHDVLAGVPDLLWTIDYASRRVSSHNQHDLPFHPSGSQFAKLSSIFPARVARQFLETLIELQNTQRQARFEYTLGAEHEQHTFEARLTPLSERDCVVIIRDVSHIKATEAALFKQQLFTQQIIDASPNLVFIRDQHGRFLLVNQTTQTLLGHDQIVHSHLGLHDDTPILSAGDEQVLASGEVIRIEDSCVLASGRRHWFDMTKLAIAREGATYILTIAIDITAQKENELAQTESGILIRAMANTLPHPMLLVQQEQIQFANHAACQALGFSPDELIGKTLPELGCTTCLHETLPADSLLLCDGLGQNTHWRIGQLPAPLGHLLTRQD
ncbi:PAS domain-containing protein [Chitinibacter sp. ZOR0017]|uniref:PAS domain-containing protein n=1 Tax=Chitinibacter sp. ZOR0017 TaxID=1339254 RepID=UPI000646C0E5|nr:PAS domain-containing protein [Chitinibacter sp. ZOR0017]